MPAGSGASAVGAQVDRNQRQVAVIGAGTIGLSWAALFAAHGFTVRVQDPRPDVGAEVEAAVRHYAGLQADPAGGVSEELLARIEVVGDVEAAVTGADVVQENAPERLPLKQELCARIEAAAPRAGADRVV